MMKHLIFTLTFLFFYQSADAQFGNKERIANDASGGKGDIDNLFLSWGYFLGFNSLDFNFDYKDQFGDLNTDVQVEKIGGFNVGLIGDLKINNYMNLRLEPGLYYTQRNLIYPGFEDEVDFLREVKSTYIHVPLLLKVSTKRLNNFKPFIVGGISTSVNLSSNETNPEDNQQGQFRTTRNSSFYELGFGVDLYFYYFKFTPSIRGVFGLKDELIQDEDPNSVYTSNIDKLSTRGIFVNFTFQ